jgi:hypothetical protein
MADGRHVSGHISRCSGGTSVSSNTIAELDDRNMIERRTATAMWGG